MFVRVQWSWCVCWIIILDCLSDIVIIRLPAASHTNGHHSIEFFVCIGFCRRSSLVANDSMDSSHTLHTYVYAENICIRIVTSSLHMYVCTQCSFYHRAISAACGLHVRWFLCEKFHHVNHQHSLFVFLTNYPFWFGFASAAGVANWLTAVQFSC